MTASINSKILAVKHAFRAVKWAAHEVRVYIRWMHSGIKY